MDNDLDELDESDDFPLEITMDSSELTHPWFPYFHKVDELLYSRSGIKGNTGYYTFVKKIEEK